MSTPTDRRTPRVRSTVTMRGGDNVTQYESNKQHHHHHQQQQQQQNNNNNSNHNKTFSQGLGFSAHKKSARYKKNNSNEAASHTKLRNTIPSSALGVPSPRARTASPGRTEATTLISPFPFGGRFCVGQSRVGKGVGLPGGRSAIHASRRNALGRKMLRVATRPVAHTSHCNTSHLG